MGGLETTRHRDDFCLLPCRSVFGCVFLFFYFIVFVSPFLTEGKGWFGRRVEGGCGSACGGGGGVRFVADEIYVKSVRWL